MVLHRRFAHARTTLGPYTLLMTLKVPMHLVILLIVQLAGMFLLGSLMPGPCACIKGHGRHANCSRHLSFQTPQSQTFLSNRSANLECRAK